MGLLMTITWQDITTTGIVLAAVVYLACRLVRLIRERVARLRLLPRCSPEPPEKPLVQIEQRPPKKSRSPSPDQPSVGARRGLG